MGVSALYLGDGTVSGYGIANPADTFVEIMKQSLGTDGVNAGVDWQSAEALAPTIPGLIAQHQPSEIYIVTGQQEVLTEPSTVIGAAKIKRLLRKVLQAAKDAGFTGKLRIAVPFLFLGTDWPELFDVQADLPLHVAQIAGGLDWQAVDILEQWFGDPNGYYSNTSDGYHPNPDGHAELAAAFLAS